MYSWEWVLEVWGARTPGSGKLFICEQCFVTILTDTLFIRKYASEFKQKYLNGILSLILSTEYHQL